MRAYRHTGINRFDIPLNTIDKKSMGLTSEQLEVGSNSMKPAAVNVSAACSQFAAPWHIFAKSARTKLNTRRPMAMVLAGGEPHMFFFGGFGAKILNAKSR